MTVGRLIEVLRALEVQYPEVNGKQVLVSDGGLDEEPPAKIKTVTLLGCAHCDEPHIVIEVE